MKVEEKIRAIEEEMARTQYHKGTEHHFGKLKAKLAQLRKMAAQKRGGRKRFSVRKSGDATVVLIGETGVGKSSLFNRLTGAYSKVGGHPYTTQKVVPGVMSYRGAKIQVLDTPALELEEGEILSFASIADLIVVVSEPGKDVSGILSKVKGEVLVVTNKADVRKGEGLCVSALSGEGVERLKEEVYGRLKLIRVYMKPKGGKVDAERPLVMREGATVRDVWEKLRLKGEIEHALVWGSSAKFPGQKVGEEHVLRDGDVVTIVVR